MQSAFNAEHPCSREPERKEKFASHLKQIWLEPDGEAAVACAERLIAKYGKRFPQAIECLENGLEDSLQFYEFSGNRPS
ncbi:hypothetical protein MASR2M78_21990 [Treponema sp.]